MAKERVQVQGLGDVAPGIQPTIQRAGQYGIQVQKAGTNKLQQLAGALSQINPVLQQYGALQKQQEQIGIEESKLVEEQNVIAELKKQKDVDGFSLLATTNRDRAFRDALLKRHINNTMLPNLEAKAQDLINPEKYRTRNDLFQAADQTLSDEWSAFVAEVGEEVANSTAGKAMWSVVTSPYKNELAAKYEKAKDTFVAGTISDDIGKYLKPRLNRFDEVSGKYIIDVNGIKDGVAVFDERLSEDLPHLTKPERSKFLVNNFANELEGLYAAQRYTDASRMLSVLKTTELNDSFIFTTPTAKDILNPIETKINNAIEKYADKKEKKKVGIYVNKVTEAQKALYLVKTKEQLDANPVLRAELMEAFSFSGLGNGEVLTEERKQQAIDELFNPDVPGLPLQKFIPILKKLAKEGGEESYDHLYDGLDDINEGLINAIKTPGAPVVLDDETKKDIIENPVSGLKAKLKENPRLSLLQFQREHPTNFEVWNDLKKEYADLTRSNYVFDTNVWKTSSDIFEERLTQVNNKIIEDFEIKTTEAKQELKSESEIYSKALQSDIETLLKTEAAKPEILELEPEVRERKLREKLDEIVAYHAERYQGITKAMIDFKENTAERKVDVEVPTELTLRKTQKRREAEFVEFKSLKPPEMVSRKIGRRVVMQPAVISSQLINEDRKKMMEGGFATRNQLRLSLYRYGMDRWNPKEAVEMMDQADMTYLDVKLFGSHAELAKVMDKWLPVMYKDIGYVEKDGVFEIGDAGFLTEEELKIRDEYQSFGLAPLSEDDIVEKVLDGANGFEEAQLSLLR